MLLGITAINRGSELGMLDSTFLSKFSNCYSFEVCGLMKHSKQGKKPNPVRFYPHTEEEILCPVSVINAYLNLTEPWRGSNPRVSKFFLSYVPPHRPVCKSTIAGWIKQFLQMCNVDVGLFQAHSTRSASSSKALLKGLSVQDILDRGNWSHESTWQKFYHKEIETPGMRFQKRLFKKL